MKKIVTWCLLFFVTITVVMQIIKTVRPIKETTFADGKHLVIFHAKVRCPACRTMERLVDQVLHDDFRQDVEQGVFVRHVLDYESQANKHLVEKYKIATATVLLVEQKEGRFVHGVNLAESCWKFIGNEPAFRQMIKTQLTGFLQGKELNLESETEEIPLDPAMYLFDNTFN